MEEKDLKQIKKIIDDSMDRGLDEFAQITAKGFENTASKQDIAGIKQDITGIKQDIEGLDERMQIVESKLDKALYREFQRIDKLETEMKIVKEKLGI